MSDQKDLDLVLRFRQKRESGAFERIFSRHRNWIYQTCRRFLRSPDRAEDATQEVFARCIEKLDTFQGTNLAGWLKAIAVNCCLNIIEREKRWVALEAAEDRVGSSPTPERQLIVEEKTIRARRVIERLPQKQKLVFCMKYVDGCSYQEIEALTGFSSKEVKSFLQNARRNFEKRWRAEGGGS